MDRIRNWIRTRIQKQTLHLSACPPTLSLSLHHALPPPSPYKTLTRPSLPIHRIHGPVFLCESSLSLSSPHYYFCSTRFESANTHTQSITRTFSVRIYSNNSLEVILSFFLWYWAHDVRHFVLKEL
ncbi:hypothetical protein L6452_34636 [Arctium lappa]|uniref:Uncharacterized protein n=1 Tax=Arctium lappa TaxID=4217 RepID=A0ACB8YI07_ARCLA|nr:hypothetical protein L6452_34636 [Arctium lappa]